MIIFNKEKYEGTFLEENIGITGENLVNEVEFTVNGFAGENITAAIHLRFSDGSVNSVAPQSVKVINNSTCLMWKISKNDIFCHGWVEVQLELRDGERLLQTEIIRLFAGESLPIEDKEYNNPNSETLALRDEVQKLWAKTAEQNEKIEKNKRVIEQSDLSFKEDKQNKAVVKGDVTAQSYASVEYLNNYYYDAEEVDRQITDLDETVTMKINLKADKADTLSGYGITDAYDKTYLNKALNNKLIKMPFDTVPAANSPNYVTSGTLYSSVNTLNQTIAKNKTAAENAIAAKYDSSNVESGTGSLTPGQAIYDGNEGSFNYVKNGRVVTVSVNITKLVADKSYIQMAGLPFPAKSESRFSSTAVYSTTNKLRNIRLDGSWLYINSPTDKFTDDEKINFTITYIRQ
ncbi:hypothetical protein DXC23_11420 [Eubacterium sp. OM08-24]|uniref:hypothetical protein n=1 Tax=Eubacterium sp. OM08-24 TaxID=2292352 RepID=UPI000E42EA58|nr:hypothetical protein [Eubacterium sp. OM08-24]RGM17428.1 hypothetical protein DXC23_11420 [Eubacterium sp. OM08-24]